MFHTYCTWGIVVVHLYCDFSMRRQMAPQQTAEFRTAFLVNFCLPVWGRIVRWRWWWLYSNRYSGLGLGSGCISWHFCCRFRTDDFHWLAAHLTTYVMEQCYLLAVFRSSEWPFGLMTLRTGDLWPCLSDNGTTTTQHSFYGHFPAPAG